MYMINIAASTFLPHPYRSLAVWFASVHRLRRDNETLNCHPLPQWKKT
jgi:hypothetical protein